MTVGPSPESDEIQVGDGLGLPPWIPIENEPAPWWFMGLLGICDMPWKQFKTSRRKFKVRWSTSVVEDLKGLEAIDLTDMLASEVEPMLKAEIDKLPIDTTLQYDLERLYGLHGRAAYKKAVKELA